MAQAKRSDIDHNRDPLAPRPAAEYRYDAGGHIGQLQADLAHRLMSQDVGQAPVLDTPAGERVVRFLSVAGGYGGLLAGYVVAGMAILHWM